MVVQHILAVRKGRREVKNDPDPTEEKEEQEVPSDSVEGGARNSSDTVETKEESQNSEACDNENEKEEDNELKKCEEKEKGVEKEDDEEKEEDEEKDKDKDEEKKMEVDKVESETIEPVKEESRKDEKEKEWVEVDEFYVKYRNFSYLHCEWKTEEELLKGDKRVQGKIKRFMQKMAHLTNIFENVGGN